MTDIIRLTKEDMQIQQENALDLFYSGIKASETKRKWESLLKRFLVGACDELFSGDFKQRAQQFVDLVKQNQDQATQLVMSYVRQLKKRTQLDRADANYLNPATLPSYVMPIKKLLDMNGCGLGWKRIHSIYPERNNTHDGRGYTREEIQLLLEHSDGLATDFLILVMSSNAMRVGGWEVLQWKHVFPIYKTKDGYGTDKDESVDGVTVCAAMIIYAGTVSQYTTLISIEAWEKLQLYKQEWTVKMGKSPTDSDPLILERYIYQKPITTTAVQRRMEKLLKKSGLRTPLTEGKRRHDVPTCHGFRRYANTIMMKTAKKQLTLSSLVIKERLLGHGGLVKTDKNYFWTDIGDLVPEYLEAMPELMISDEYRLKTKLEDQTKRADKLEQANKDKDTALEKMKELEAKVDRMSRYRRE
jgi:integrase